MARLVFLIASALITAVTLPKLYQDNPELFARIAGKEDTSEPRRVSVNRQTKSVSSNPLSGRQVRLAMDARGHFVSDFKLNGRTIKALVDTGATYVAINSRTARRIGIHLTPSDYKFSVNTANGHVRAASAKIDEMRIGRIRVTDVQAAVLPDKALQDTLIGMSFLKQLAGFEIRNQELVLRQ